MDQEQYSTNALVVAQAIIPQDNYGRYNLNALHQVSGSADTKRPSDWLRRKSTKELIRELASQVVDSPLDVIHGGDRPGTYAHELLAISYAGWISPAFQLKVNQAFLDMKSMRHNVPQVKDPAIQMLIDMAVHLDEARTIANEAKVIAQQAIETQQWLTIREYVFLNNLERQFPPSFHAGYGRYLTAYCQEHGIPVRKMGVADRQYATEHAYHVGTIADTMKTWLFNRTGQSELVAIRHSHAKKIS